MRNILAITVLTVGLAGGAMAQNYQSGPDAPLTADTPSTDNNKVQNNKEQKEAPQKPDCKVDKQSSAAQQDTAQADHAAQNEDQAPQNVIEYGG